ARVARGARGARPRRAVHDRAGPRGVQAHVRTHARRARRAVRRRRRVELPGPDADVEQALPGRAASLPAQRGRPAARPVRRGGLALRYRPRMTTMIGPLRRATQIAADQTAIACGDIELTYAQTWDRCRRLLRGLRALGMKPGDRIAIVSAN